MRRSNKPSKGEVFRAYRREAIGVFTLSVIAIGAWGVAHYYKDVHRSPDQCSSDGANNPTTSDPDRLLGEFALSTGVYTTIHGLVEASGISYMPNSPGATTILDRVGNSQYFTHHSSIKNPGDLVCLSGTTTTTYVVRNGAFGVADALVDAGAPNPLKGVE
ncbi:MAG: hypothetical protein MUF85_00900 [Patescibacteria group bacterium]|nr:hypothetical protein [Patescibacteria group bacterium]